MQEGQRSDVLCVLVIRSIYVWQSACACICRNVSLEQRRALHVHVYAGTHLWRAEEGTACACICRNVSLEQRRAPNVLQKEFQEAVSHPVLVLGAKLRASAKVAML